MTQSQVDRETNIHNLINKKSRTTILNKLLWVYCPRTDKAHNSIFIECMIFGTFIIEEKKIQRKCLENIITVSNFYSIITP